MLRVSLQVQSVCVLTSPRTLYCSVVVVEISILSLGHGHCISIMYLKQELEFQYEDFRNLKDVNVLCHKP